MTASAARHPNHRAAATLPPELRRTTVPPAVRAWIERETGAAVAGIRRLAGASSTAVHGLELRDGRRLVLRRYAWPGFVEDDPAAPQRELDALAFARQSGLPVPAVVAADVAGTDVGDGVPAVLMSLVRGRAVAVPDVHRLAEVVAAIHSVDAGRFGHAYFRWTAGDFEGPPPTARRPALWERALHLWATAVPPYRPVFVHRDFHPGNVLWLRGRCSGVVDWAEACRGPAGCDIAHCRTNLIRLAGVRVAAGFVAAYESITGETHHPYWDLASVLEHGPDWTSENVAHAERRMARALAAMPR
ncbi:MAG: phosphotransferase family protein [Acidimicrobiales bacterium]